MRITPFDRFLFLDIRNQGTLENQIRDFIRDTPWSIFDHDVIWFDIRHVDGSSMVAQVGDILYMHNGDVMLMQLDRGPT